MSKGCVLVTGASGFVGKNVVKALLNDGYKVKALSRNKPNDAIFNDVEFITCDILDYNAWAKHAQDVDTIIHLVGIIREIQSQNITFERLHVEATQAVINVCKQSNVDRIVHMSANGASPSGVSNYQRTKFQAEEIVEKSGLRYTIFRPSLICGDDDKFFNMLREQMDKYSFLPIFGNGWYMLQPVSVIDVAKCFVKSIDSEECINNIFHLGGEKVYSYQQIINMIADTFDKKIYTPHVPLMLVKSATRLMAFSKSFPVTIDQLNMLVEGNICPETEVFDILDIKRQDMQLK